MDSDGAPSQQDAHHPRPRVRTSPLCRAHRTGRWQEHALALAERTWGDCGLSLQEALPGPHLPAPGAPWGPWRQEEGASTCVPNCTRARGGEER